jgi:AcrR family transcriptional regulator
VVVTITPLIQPDDRSPQLAGGVLPLGFGGLRPSARRLLEAAVIAFAERGYHGVSVRDVAAAAGIKAGSLYAHFPSKEAMLSTIIRYGHEAHQAHVRSAILAAGATAPTQLRAAVHANVTFHATYPLLTIVANAELHALPEADRAVVLANRYASGQLMAAVLERGHELGDFDCPDAWLAMSAIAGMGVRVAWWYRPADLRDAASPLAAYPNLAATWLPAGDYTTEVIDDAYAEFALRIVGAGIRR